MRYVGQGYEVQVPLDDHGRAEGMRERLASAFESVYRQLYGRTEAGTPVEIVSWRVVVMSEAPDITPAAVGTLTDGGHAKKGTRPVYSVLRKAFVETPVYDRYSLGTSTDLQGPAIVEERESTVVVPDRARITVDRFRNLIIDLPDVQAAD
jgi:N-methylhydantoinase A